ncbi:hypothetical protein [Streptomyces sp. NPDC054783]
MKRISNTRRLLMLTSTAALIGGGALLPATAFAAAPAAPHIATATHRDGGGPGPDDGGDGGDGSDQVPNRPGPGNLNQDSTGGGGIIHRVYAPWLYGGLYGWF